MTPGGEAMEEIFKLEYHPEDASPRRVRFLVTAGSDTIERVVERRENGEWHYHHSETIEYFEYSDE